MPPPVKRERERVSFIPASERELALAPEKKEKIEKEHEMRLLNLRETCRSFPEFADEYHHLLDEARAGVGEVPNPLDFGLSHQFSICRFFGTPRGCRGQSNGQACGFFHGSLDELKHRLDRFNAAKNKRLKFISHLDDFIEEINSAYRKRVQLHENYQNFIQHKRHDWALALRFCISCNCSFSLEKEEDKKETCTSDKLSQTIQLRYVWLDSDILKPWFDDVIDIDKEPWLDMAKARKAAHEVAKFLSKEHFVSTGCDFHANLKTIDVRVLEYWLQRIEMDDNYKPAIWDNPKPNLEPSLVTINIDSSLDFF